MQLYRVQFRVHYANSIDLGDVLTCASDQDNARLNVIHLLNLPISCLQIEVTRVKPNIYELSRKLLPKHNSKPTQALPATHPLLDRPHEYHCDVKATIKGMSEEHVLRQMAASLYDRSSGRNSNERISVNLTPVVQPKLIKMRLPR
jgi:hypothetical protein